MLDKLKQIYAKYREMANYLWFGILTTGVNWVVFQLFNAGFHWHWTISNVIAWICSVIFAYATNRKYVFASSNRHILREFLMFVQFRLISFGIEMLVMEILISIFLLKPFLAKVITAVIVVISNYIFSKLIVFRKGKSQDGSD